MSATFVIGYDADTMSVRVHHNCTTATKPRRIHHATNLDLTPRFCAIKPHLHSSDTTMGRRNHYHVYVIELSKDVLYEGKFKKCNPDYVTGKPCVYVGMTGLDPDVRFDKHKAGIQSNRYVKQYGLRLLPDLYEAFNPMPYEEACDKEVEVGIDLRSAGFGVWQA